MPPESPAWTSRLDTRLLPVARRERGRAGVMSAAPAGTLAVAVHALLDAGLAVPRGGDIPPAIAQLESPPDTSDHRII